jgi:hypothetical protein
MLRNQCKTFFIVSLIKMLLYFVLCVKPKNQHCSIILCLKRKCNLSILSKLKKKMTTRRDREDDLIQKQNPLSKIPFIQKILFFSCKNATLKRLAQLMSVHSFWYETIRNPRFGTAGTIFCNNMSDEQKSEVREFLIDTCRGTFQQTKLVFDFIQCGIVPGVIQFLDETLLLESLLEYSGHVCLEPEMVHLFVAYGARRPEKFDGFDPRDSPQRINDMCSNDPRSTGAEFENVAKINDLLSWSSEQDLIDDSVFWYCDKYNCFPPAATLQHKRNYLEQVRQRIRDFEMKIKACKKVVASLEEFAKE